MTSIDLDIIYAMHREQTRAFNVEIKDDAGMVLKSGTVSACSTWHAIELAYTKAQHKYPDRTKYKATILKVMLN